MIKVFAKYVLLIILINSIVYAQSNVIRLLNKNKESVKVSESKSKDNIKNHNSNSKSDENNSYDIMKINFDSFIHPQFRKSSNNFNDDFFGVLANLKNTPFVSSVKNNIKVRLSENGFTVVNFTPGMQINASENITLDVNHSISMYLPVKSAKENIGYLVVESAAVLAVDNLVNYFHPLNNTLNSIIGFTVKNIFVALINKSLKNILPHIQEFRQYFYSINIRL